MSRAYDVFVRCDLEVAELAERVGSLLHMTFQDDSEADLERWLALGLDMAIMVFTAEGYLDSYGIEFTKYTHVIAVSEPRRVIPHEAWLNLQESTAVYIGCAVAQRLGYPCIVVEDMQRLIATCDPL